MYRNSFRRLCSSARKIIINPSSHYIHQRTSNINFKKLPLKTVSTSIIHHSTSKSLLNRINRVLISHPVLTGSLFNGILAQLADLFVQNKIENKQWHTIDWMRNFSFFLYYIHNSAAAYFMFIKLYPFLFPSTKRYCIPLRILFDQFIITPICYFPLFYTCKCLVFENKSFGFQKWKQYQNKYWNENIFSDNLRSAEVWCPANFITITLIPNHLKLFWMSFVSFVSVSVLSAMRGANDENKNIYA